MNRTKRLFVGVQRVDVAIAAAIFVVGQIEIPLFGVPGDPLAAHVLWAVAGVATLFRRTHPMALAVVGAIVLGLRYRYELTPEGGAVFGIFGLLTIYGAGAYTRGPARSLAAAATAVALHVIAMVWVTAADEGPFVELPAVEWLGQIAIYITAALGGVVLRDRSEPLAAARRRAAEVPTERDAVAAALADERAIVARDLQALVSAAVRGVLALANRASAVLARSAAEAAEALARARELSRGGLDEMRRMLALLRAPDESAGRRPEPPPPSGIDRLRARIPAGLRGQGMPLLVLAVGIPEALLAQGQPPELYGTADLAVRIAGVAAVAAALVPRRRFPLLSTIVVSAVLISRVALLDDFFALNLTIYLAAFSSGAYGRTPSLAALGGAIVVGAAVAIPSLVGATFPLGAYVYVVATSAAAWATGFAGRRRLREADELERLTDAEAERRRVSVDRAVAEERLRVARELHDLVGHGLTSVTIQCAAGERTAQTNPKAAREVIANVGAAAHATLDELGQLLDALGGGSEALPPSITGIGELVGRSRAAGLDVRLEARGDLERVPSGQSAAAYRIIQEALTNARKHGAAGAIVILAVEADEDSVSVRISNQAEPRVARAGGHGLVGMAERVRVYGGSLSAGQEGRSWVVAAEIPIGTSDPAPLATLAG